MPTRRPAEAGFTLLEVLIAFVIAALALGVMFDGVLGGMRAAAIAGHTQQALALARSRLASVGVAIESGAAATVTEQDGDDGQGFTYSVRVRPASRITLQRGGGEDAPLGGQGTPAAAKATLYAIAVTVSWKADGGSRRVRLDGARLVLLGAPST